MSGFSLRASIFQTPTPDALQVLPDQLIEIADDGRISAIRHATPHDQPDEILPPNHVLIPGMIDTHVHAPQWPQLGTALDRPLEEWLFDHTFPIEARFADTGFAEKVWSSMVPTLLGLGTTTAVYHASVHEEATIALAQACHQHGQRAFVGRVAMDHPEGTPEWYRDTSADIAVDASARSIEQIRALSGRPGLVEPIVTPRFIPACTDAALEGLGELAAATGVRVQTHVSESDWEHQYVLDRFGITDTHALEQFGLVADHTVLAHGTHLTDDDRNTLIRHGAGVSHCPLSNAYFSERIFPARRQIAAGLRTGLGTDIAGGAEASLLAQCGHAVTSARHLDANEPDNRIDIVAAFWMATVGGADLLGIDAGLLRPGNLFDAIAVDLGAVGVMKDLDDHARTFEKLVRRSNDRAITRVWVDGVNVVTRSDASGKGSG